MAHVKRITVGLTERQADQLAALANESGASQSAIVSLAITQYLRRNAAPEKSEQAFTVFRDGHEAAWLRGSWADEEHTSIRVAAVRYSADGEWQETAKTWLYAIGEGETCEVRRTL